MTRGKRLGIDHVERRPGDAAVVECGDQRVLVDQRAPRDVHEMGTRFDRGQRLGVEEVIRLRRSPAPRSPRGPIRRADRAVNAPARCRGEASARRGGGSRAPACRRPAPAAPPRRRSRRRPPGRRSSRRAAPAWRCSSRSGGSSIHSSGRCLTNASMVASTNSEIASALGTARARDGAIAERVELDAVDAGAEEMDPTGGRRDQTAQLLAAAPEGHDDLGAHGRRVVERHHRLGLGHHTAEHREHRVAPATEAGDDRRRRCVERGCRRRFRRVRHQTAGGVVSNTPAASSRSISASVEPEELGRDGARVFTEVGGGADVGADHEVATERGAVEHQAPHSRLIDRHREPPGDVVRVGGHLRARQHGHGGHPLRLARGRNLVLRSRPSSNRGCRRRPRRHGCGAPRPWPGCRPSPIRAIPSPRPGPPSRSRRGR